MRNDGNCARNILRENEQNNIRVLYSVVLFAMFREYFENTTITVLKSKPLSIIKNKNLYISLQFMGYSVTDFLHTLFVYIVKMSLVIHASNNLVKLIVRQFNQYIYQHKSICIKCKINRRNNNNNGK